MLRTLVENDRYRLTLAEPETPSDITVIDWPHWRNQFHALVDSPFPPAEESDFATRKGMNSLRVETRRNDWFQSDEIDEVVAAIAALKTDRSVFLSYGGSMGGHGAIAMGPLCGADFYVAKSPQVSLDAGFMHSIGDGRWADSVPGFRYDRIAQGDCRDFPGVVILDPDATLDVRHAAVIRVRTRASVIEVRGGWHTPGKVLNRTYGVARLLQEIGTTLQEGRDPQELLTAAQAAVNEGYERAFLDGDDDTRDSLLERLGVDTLAKTLSYFSLLAALRADPSERFIGQVEAFAKTPAERRQFGTVLMVIGHPERGLEKILGEGTAQGFYVPEARDFLRASAERLGLKELRAEALRLEAEGDLEGALFCLETAQRSFNVGAMVHERIDTYRAALATQAQSATA